MTDREPGFYWVRVNNDLQPARYIHGEWQLLGCRSLWLESELDEIGPKIEPHDAGQERV